jgi:hypothetical protein
VSYKTQRDAVETKVKEKRNALVKEEQDLVKDVTVWALPRSSSTSEG